MVSTGLPYASSAPLGVSSLGTPQAFPTVAGKSEPTSAIGQVASPYRSQGPSTLPASGSPQAPGALIAGGAYLGDGGAMSVQSPYESTAAPGTSSPFAASNAPQSGALGAAGAGTGAAVDPAAGSGGAPASGLGGVGSGAPSAFAMIGDASPPFARYVSAAASNNPPQPPDPTKRSRIAPSVRGFKIAENQSPVPQDRFFFSFNYYDDVNRTLNKAFNAPIKGVNIYRYVFGYEKTFNQGMGSVGIRFPIDNVFARSAISSTVKAGGNSTSTGNLTVYLKHIFAIDRETGSVASGGVAITPQTGPSTFGGARFLAPNNTTTIQPYFAFLFNRDRFYIQGFSAIDIPVDPSQATIIYNDLGIGYYVYRDNESTGLITAVAPTFEVHVNTPINHSGAYNAFDNNGTPDIVNLTSGLNTRIRQNSILTMGVVTPVTGPRPFSIEATVLLNVYYGRSRRNPAAPVIGG